MRIRWSSQTENRVTVKNVMRAVKPVFPCNRTRQAESFVDCSGHVFRTLGVRGWVGSEAIGGVPRSLELTHADPAAFATALGRDPARIFAFVEPTIKCGAESEIRPRNALRARRGDTRGLDVGSAPRA